MKAATAVKQSPTGGLSGLVYGLSVAFPSWGGLLAAAYMLLGCGLRLSSLRDLWRM